MAQGLNLADFKKSNFGTIVVIGLIIVALLFAPDFFKFDGKKKDTKDTEKVVETDSEHKTFDNTYFDRVIDAKVAGKSIEDVDPNNPGWDFTSDNAKKILQEARKQSLELANLIPVEASASRFALYNYANGLQSVAAITGEIDGKEVSDYLTKLDLDVSKALTADRQPRNIIFSWSKISISGVLGNKRTDRFKEGIVPDFNPKLFLSNVSLVYTIPKSGEFNPKSSYSVSFKMIFDASEVNKLEVFHNGLLIKNTSGSAKDQGMTFFELSNQDASGYYSFSVTDRYGYKAIKHYRFIPREVKKLPWKLIRNDSYGVNFKATSEDDYINLDGVFGYNIDDSNLFLPSNSRNYELF